MGTKVVYNNCHGGFGLSPIAVRRAREISGNPKWADAVLPGEYFSDGSGPAGDFMDTVHIRYDFPRHDPVLVRIVEELGTEASGELASLAIATVKGPYRIDDYDGAETVMEPKDDDWLTP